jgi:membrane-bound lytic murein transglycosylase D
MRYLLLIITLCFAELLFAQAPKVPSNMELGNMKLNISPKGQAIIQEHVDAIHKNPAYFNRMVDKAMLYFPYISEIFREEGVPDEFKYLCIQESGIQSDAVSTSNAVGYWQFKDFTARENGLFVNREVDERKHIIYASRGAAKYLKRNYFYLKNWVYACQSYQQGLGGTQRSVDQSLFGDTRMTIDQNTYWYAIKFLAHKIAYEDAIKKYRGNSIYVETFIAEPGMRFSDIAKKNQVDLSILEEYNTWTRSSKIPDQREEYLVMIPKKGQRQDHIEKIETITLELEESNPQEINRIVQRQEINPSVRIILKINDKKAILSNSGDSPVTLALRGGVTRDQLIKYNDMILGEDVQSNMVYYLQPKNNRSNISMHISKEGETLWQISQRYGIKKKALIKKNRMSLGEEPKPGRVLWLKKKRPKNEAIEYVELPKPPLKNQTILNTEKEAKPAEVPVSVLKPVPVEKPVEIEEKELEVIQDTVENEIQEKENTIEVPSENSAVFMEHRVSAGETLYSISKKYEVHIEDIVDWNKLEHLNLSIGQVLKIKTY